ncbi:MAG: hypothetical protein OEV42_13630 [Deltaproteobacteria bacterium]|nr:hypothetical protein [Deltaproteobacteria bacterium]
MLFPVLHIVHLLTAILWIGGLAFITTLILPMIVKMPHPMEKVLLFQRLEHRFAPLARIYTAIVGISGFGMFFMMDLQDIVFKEEGKFLLFMIIIWIFWVIMLYGLEPLVVKKMLDRLASRKGDGLEIEDVFKRMNILHWVLLTISLAASASGAVFAHSLF